jgi:hypothetical protein
MVKSFWILHLMAGHRALLNRLSAKIWTVLSTSIASGVLLGPPVAVAEIYHFVAQELENRQASWAPYVVTIVKSPDVQHGFVFVLENPTTRTHIFESPGLLHDEATEHGKSRLTPLRITVAPGETVEAAVRFAQGDIDHVLTCSTEEPCYRFYCPIHRGDDDTAGIIHVKP